MKIVEVNPTIKKYVDENDGYCPEYLKEVENNEREKEIIRREKEINNAYQSIMRGLSRKK